MMMQKLINIAVSRKRAIKKLVKSLLAIVMMFLLIVTGLSYFVISSTLSEKKATYFHHLANSLNHSIDEHFRLLQSNTELLKANLALEQAFEDRDTQKLFTLSKPLFDKTLHNHSISHFYYHLPSQENLLRVHAAEKNKDVIERQVFLKSIETQQDAFDIELGVFGTLTLRYVSPWINNSGELIGYLELGIDLPSLIQRLNTFDNVVAVMAFDKAAIQRSHWESGESIFRENRLPWDFSSKRLFVTHFAEKTIIKQMAQKPNDFESLPSWITMPILNQNDQQVSEIFIHSPYSLWRQQILNKAIISSVMVAVIILLTMLVILHFIRRIRQSERRLQEAIAELDHMTSVDALTQLYNRNYFFSQLQACINDNDSQTRHPYICLVDIDDFKKINDQHFHGFGDRVLRAFAQHLVKSLPQSLWLARAGGDQFIFALEGYTTHQAIQNALQPLKRFLCFGTDKYNSLEITASIGVTRLGSGEQTPSVSAEQVFHQAELAMLRAKQNGKRTCCFFEPAFINSIQKEIAIENALKKAIENNQLSLYFQQEYDLLTREVTGVEALVRWPQEDHTFISPAEFIPIAEKSRLIIELDKWVFKTACHQYLAWKAQGFMTQININLSVRYLMEIDVQTSILDYLKLHNIPVEHIGIEITEHNVMSAKTCHIQKLETLKKAGMTIYLDDFGTGYSSLSYVQNFPISVLKIDQTFVRKAPTNPQDYALMKAIVSMGHSLKLKVIAEGIETQEHERIAQKLGCDFGQGYFYHRPQPPEEICQKVVS